MGIGILLKLVLILHVSVTCAFPSGRRQLSLVDENRVNITSPTPLPPHQVQCSKPSGATGKELVGTDCGHLLNGIFLRQAGLFTERKFFNKIYRTDAGGNALAQWWYGTCEVLVQGIIKNRQLVMTLFDVALTANKIIYECVADIKDSLGGCSPIGESEDEFFVYVRGYEIGSGNNSSVSHQPAVDVSRRAIGPPEDIASTEATRGNGTRDPPKSVMSRPAARPLATSDATLSVAIAHEHPVNCFNPLFVHLPPAVATDCSYIINQIILRLFDPTRSLTFGFTDDAEINLSKPHYQKWQHGQCMVAVKNHDMSQFDSFRLIDVATTARRVTIRCVVDAEAKIGGVADILRNERGFYVYVGGALSSRLASNGVRTLPEIAGAESS